MTPATISAPICPQCGSSMILRNGRYGYFYGCDNFPTCRRTQPYSGPIPPEPQQEQQETVAKPQEAAPSRKSKPQVVYEPIVKMPGSPEQEAIWDALLTGNSHIVVNALAGCGKTHSMIQGCLRAPKDWQILFVAFNRHIAAEANGKLRASGCTNVRACTYHALGYRLLRDRFPSLGSPNENKVTEILEELCPPPIYGKANWRKILNLAEKLTTFAKNCLLDPKAENFTEELERLADHHSLDINGSFKQAADFVPEVLEQCKKRAAVSVDYNDMIYLPIVLDLPVSNRCDIMFVDEGQDLNGIQHDLTFKVCFRGRIVLVGDLHQAIYGFRGSDTESIGNFTARLAKTERGVQEFPLTITRRCPRSHVALVQSIVPNIRALDDAPEGEILEMAPNKAVIAMQPGDMVLSRTNKHLIPVAYDLINRGIKAVIRGRDIGSGLLTLLNKLETGLPEIDEQDPSDEDMNLLASALNAYRYQEETKLLKLGDKAEGRLNSLHDKCDCLMEFIRNSASIAEMKARIESIFSDFESDGTPKNAVILGSIHRCKGLESERVFILAPEEIPHPMARKPWEVQQEHNAAYVAATRAKFNHKTGAPGTLIFVGSIPPIFNSQQEGETECTPS